MVFNDECREASLSGGGSFVEVWKLTDSSLLESKAMFGNRAGVAFGIAGSADECAQLHQGLVEVGAGGAFLIFDF